MMVSNINQTLLTHLATGGGAAFKLRATFLLRGLQNMLPATLAATLAFFQTRTDIRRLNAAQEVATAILSLYDQTELISIRDIVAKQELRRQIHYARQKDHTAHTVYLYLLGLWLYDNIPAITTALRTKYTEEKDKNEQDNGPDFWFLHLWSFASLLHDVGYVFQNLDADTLEDRKQIDSIYSLEWVRRQYSSQPLSADAERTLDRVFAVWEKRYSKKMGDNTATMRSNDLTKLLLRLAQAPWLGDLDSDLSGKDIFEVLDAANLGLRNYAIEVATDGYGGKGSCVDHAIASGLLLFQYSSFWYWLIENVRESASDVVYKELTSGLRHPRSFVTHELASACRAVAFHNIRPEVKAARSIIPSLTLAKEPLTFLSVLADELQCWDRFPAGSADLEDYRALARTGLESTDVSISVSCWTERADAKGVFTVDFSSDRRENESAMEGLRNKLRGRLFEYSQVIRTGAPVAISDAHTA